VTTGETTPDKPVLVLVDDSDDDRFFARRAHRLAKLGVALVCLESGPDMLAYQARVDAGDQPRPVAILLDINMPGLDGFATYERLVAATPGPPPPVWFLTGSDDPTDIARADALGVAGLLTKPASVRQLAQLMARVVDVATDSASGGDCRETPVTLRF